MLGNITAQSQVLTTLKKHPYEKNVEKEENACNKYLTFFHNVLRHLIILATLNFLSANAFNMGICKTFLPGIWVLNK